MRLPPCVYFIEKKIIKNKKVHRWEKKNGEKSNLSAGKAKIKFRSIRTAYGRYLREGGKRLD